MEAKTDMKETKTKKISFFDICDDQSYFERELNTRNYVVCPNCGFIQLSMVDRETKFLDLHCKCGSPATWASFSEEEIVKMVEDKIESDRCVEMMKDTFASIGMT